MRKPLAGPQGGDMGAISFPNQPRTGYHLALTFKRRKWFGADAPIGVLER
jgi:hypothetical protein